MERRRTPRSRCSRTSGGDQGITSTRAGSAAALNRGTRHDSSRSLLNWHSSFLPLSGRLHTLWAGRKELLAEACNESVGNMPVLPPVGATSLLGRSGNLLMSHSSIQPIPADRPVADSRVCPFCLRAVHSLREGKGHRYPCPCIDIERVSAVRASRHDEQPGSVGRSGGDPLGDRTPAGRVTADTPSVQGGGPNPLARTGSARGRSPEPRWQDIDNPFWVEEF